MKYSLFVTLALALVAAARPRPMNYKRLSQAENVKNGQDAIALNNKFKTLADGSACNAGDLGCVGDKFAQCVNGKFLSQACAPGTQCAALPLVNAVGTSIACTTAADLSQRLAATGAQGGAAAAAPPPPPAAAAAPPPPPAANNAGAGGAAAAAPPPPANNNDPQQSLTLDPAVISKGFANNGQDVPTAGQVASLTSNNNFINFCLTTKLPLTNGQQVTTGSCNTAPIGAIPSTQNMPASKFNFPKNTGTVAANTKFTVSMNIARMVTGNFVNAKENYFAAPQQLNAQGQIIGHTHIVIEKLTAIDQTTVPDPNVFAFFKGVNTAAVNGAVTVDVDPGLAAGVYRMCSINAAANHQPVILPIAQHGNSDDCIYFTAQ